MMKRRVVVTGLGCVTPLGNDVESTWQAQKACRNGVGAITHFDATHFPTKFAAEVRDYHFESYVDNVERFANAGLFIGSSISSFDVFDPIFLKRSCGFF